VSDFLFVGRFSIYNLDFTVIDGSNNVVNADAPPLGSFRNYATDAETFVRAFAVTGDVGKYRLVLSSLETEAQGLYYVYITYNLGGIPQSYRVDIEIPSSTASAYEALTDDPKGIIELTWLRFEDMFDSEIGGPNLKEYAQSNFGRERLAQLLALAMGRLNTTTQPHQTFSLAMGDFPYAEFGGLLELCLYVETIKHLIRSYVEQPSVQGNSTVRLDRRDYYTRWMEILRLEQEDLQHGIDIFKMSYLGLGRAAVLVGGGIYGELVRPMPLSRPRYRQIAGWIR
jgi:hypothetical protein